MPGPARIILVENKAYEAVDWNYLKQLPIYRQFIPKRLLVPGAVVALKTSEGDLAKLRVVAVSEDDSSITLDWTLYRAPGQTKKLDITTARERLSQAIQESDVTKTKELLSEFPELIGHIDEFALTPLHEAARYDKPSVAAVLIEAGADVNETGAGHLPYDWQLRAPLYDAIAGRSVEIAECLLRAGARLPKTSRERRELRRAVKHSTPAIKCLLKEYGYPAK